MENQHRKITGYRELNKTEIDLMNRVKALGVEMEDVLAQVMSQIRSKNLKTDDVDGIRALDNATPVRFLALAKTEFQTGLMYVTRAVEQPEFF